MISHRRPSRSPSPPPRKSTTSIAKVSNNDKDTVPVSEEPEAAPSDGEQNEELDEEAQMMALMGFGGFDSTKVIFIS